MSTLAADVATGQEYGQWKHKPHIRFGDPCHDCGTKLAPASRRWAAETLPPGVRKHAGNGLCGACAGRRDRETPGWRAALLTRQEARRWLP